LPDPSGGAGGERRHAKAPERAVENENQTEQPEGGGLVRRIRGFRAWSAYAPAAGRLAAAIATIKARRRPIRDGAERSNKLNCRISRIPRAPAEQPFREEGAE